MNTSSKGVLMRQQVNMVNLTAVQTCSRPSCYFLDLLVSTYDYVTYEDIKHLGDLRDQTVIVVKAPTDTKLEVPDPDEVGVHTQRLYL